MAKRKTLREIVAEMTDKKKIKEFTSPHDEALRTFKPEEYEFDDYEKLRDAVEGYIQHHHMKVYKTEAKLPEPEALNRAHDLLVSFGRRLLNDENALEEDAIAKVVEDIGKTGKLSDLLHAYTVSQRDNMENQYRLSVVRKNVKPQDHEHGTEIAGDFIKYHEDLLPKEDRDEFETLPPQALAHKATTLITDYAAKQAEAKLKLGRQKKYKKAA